MIDPASLSEELARRLAGVMADLQQLKREIDNADHLAELCSLQGQLADAQEAMKELARPSQPLEPDGDPRRNGAP